MAQRRIHAFFALLALIVLSIPCDVRSQTTLDRLEKQVRDRVAKQPTPPPPQPGIGANASPVATAVPAGQADNREPGYLGLVADDQKDRGRGVRVLDVAADGPAAKGGLKKQDLITAIAGVRTRQMTEMSDMLNRCSAGDSIEIDVLRDNKPQKLEVTLGRRPGQHTGALRGEAIPTPPGEPVGGATPQPRSNDPVAQDESKKSSMLDLFRLKSANSAEKKTTPSNGETPALISPNHGDQPARPSIEQLQKRIDELERRVAALEKALAEKNDKGQ
jgi:hypothetical protein